jgi:uncharacterized protein (DUF302 family)
MIGATSYSKTIPIEHIVIRSRQPFDEVKNNLERSIPQIDDGVFTLLRYGEHRRALAELQAMPPLMIFGVRDHGALLGIVEQSRRSLQYDIGNPLTAAKMTRHRLSAGLYAPIRVLLLDHDDGHVAFEYDRPVSTFGQFGNLEIDTIARELDRTLQRALKSAAS